MDDVANNAKEEADRLKRALFCTCYRLEDHMISSARREFRERIILFYMHVVSARPRTRLHYSFTRQPGFSKMPC